MLWNPPPRSNNRSTPQMNPHRPTARDGVHKDQPTKNQQSPPWCKPCQKEVRPVRPKISIGWLALCIALCWLILLPLVLFAISRLAKEAICPDCRQHIPKAKVPFDTEAVIMTGLIVLWIGAVIRSQIIN